MNILTDEQNEFLKDLVSQFKFSASSVDNIAQKFHFEMERGLAGRPSSLKMLPAYVSQPSGKEKGKYLAVDLGGTNLRVLLVSLDGEGNSVVEAVKKVSIPNEMFSRESRVLFDFVASSIESFFIENRIERTCKFDLGFTFSFPVNQLSVNSGKLICWTKGFAITDGAGEDVVELISNSLKGVGFENIKVVALLNDTVGTLVEESYANASCDMGVILGTGSNACYLEKTRRISKLKENFHSKNMIVNMEWGNFNGYSSTTFDRSLDRNSTNPGEQCFEKMVSGMYLGELSRLVLCEMIERKLLSNKVSISFLNQANKLKTEDMAIVASDCSVSLTTAEEHLCRIGLLGTSVSDRVILKRVFEVVAVRAARMIAAALISVVLWMDRELTEKHLIAVDGTVYEKYPMFKRNIEDFLGKYLKESSRKVLLTLTKDGSGKGAAITAAVSGKDI